MSLEGIDILPRQPLRSLTIPCMQMKGSTTPLAGRNIYRHATTIEHADGSLVDLWLHSIGNRR